jgi:hypothetical protein
MLHVWSTLAAAATPYVGVEWRPLSRGDLLWVAEGDTTGLAVGGLDGFARPQLLAYGGAWITEHVGVHGSLGVARLKSTSWVGDIYEQRHWGVIRPEIDVRVSLLSRSDPRPNPWLFLGPHADIPSARDISNGYTEEEQELADRSATIDRIRLGAVGGRFGAGVDYGLLPELHLGLLCALDWHRSLYRGSDPAVTTAWLVAEAALLLEFHWPGRQEDEL